MSVVRLSNPRRISNFGLASTAGAYGINADATDWRNRVIANGGTVSDATLAAVSAFCSAIDAAGIRSKIWRLSLFCGGNLNSALVPLYRGPSRTGTQYGNTTDTNNGPFVSGDYSETGASGGLKANGSTKFLDTGIAQSAISLNDLHLSVSFRDVTTSSSQERTFIGSFNSTQTDFSVLRHELSTGNLQGAIGTFTATGSGNAAGAATHLMASRLELNDFRLFINGSQNASSTSSIGTFTATSRSYFVFARNNAGTANNFNDGRFRMYSIGNAIDATGAAAFSGAIAAFNTALGRT